MIKIGVNKGLLFLLSDENNRIKEIANGGNKQNPFLVIKN
jgi:hypothetical protein